MISDYLLGDRRSFQRGDSRWRISRICATHLAFLRNCGTSPPLRENFRPQNMQRGSTAPSQAVIDARNEAIIFQIFECHIEKVVRSMANPCYLRGTPACGGAGARKSTGKNGMRKPNAHGSDPKERTDGEKLNQTKRTSPRIQECPGIEHKFEANFPIVCSLPDFSGNVAISGGVQSPPASLGKRTQSGDEENNEGRKARTRLNFDIGSGAEFAHVQSEWGLSRGAQAALRQNAQVPADDFTVATASVKGPSKEGAYDMRCNPDFLHSFDVSGFAREWLGHFSEDFLKVEFHGGFKGELQKNPRFATADRAVIQERAGELTFVKKGITIFTGVEFKIQTSKGNEQETPCPFYLHRALHGTWQLCTFASLDLALIASMGIVARKHLYSKSTARRYLDDFEAALTARRSQPKMMHGFNALALRPAVDEVGAGDIDISACDREVHDDDNSSSQCQCFELPPVDSSVTSSLGLEGY